MTRPAWLLAVVAAALGSGCRQKLDLPVDNLPCEGTTCLDGYVCHPESGLCVPTIAVGCSDASAQCPSKLDTGDACPKAGAFVPCADDATTCEFGCRTCNADLTWGA